MKTAFASMSEERRLRTLLEAKTEDQLSAMLTREPEIPKPLRELVLTILVERFGWL